MYFCDAVSLLPLPAAVSPSNSMRPSGVLVRVSSFLCSRSFLRSNCRIRWSGSGNCIIDLGPGLGFRAAAPNILYLHPKLYNLTVRDDGQDIFAGNYVYLILLLFFPLNRTGANFGSPGLKNVPLCLFLTWRLRWYFKEISFFLFCSSLSRNRRATWTVSERQDVATSLLREWWIINHHEQKYKLYRK